MNPEEQNTSGLKPGGFLEFFSIATPLIISNGAISLHHFVDRLFLAWYGQNEIAASLPAGILAYTFISFFLGISSYTNTFVAQYYGAQQYQNIGKATWQGIHFSIFAGIASLLLLPVGNSIIHLAGHDPDVMKLEYTYFNYIYACIFFFIINGALSSFYSGRGKTLLIMLITVASTLLNIVLDYAMIFGKWGFPEMGIKGAAIATVISAIAMTVVYFILILSKTNHEKYQTRTTYGLDYDLIKKMIRFGTPAGAQNCLGIASFTVFVFLIGQVGTVELAASNIVIAINTISFMPAVGASIAAATMVGQYIGRKDHHLAERSAYTAVYSVEAFMLFLMFIFFFFPEPIMRIFQGDMMEGAASFEAVIEYGSILLLFVAVYQVFDAMLITFSGALRGAGDTAFPMWTELICAWCFFVPGTWIILFVFDGGVIFAWFWASIYIMAVGLVLYYRFRCGYWKTIHVID